MKKVSRKHGVPNFPKNLFWNVDFNDINWEKNMRWVMSRIFTRGRWKDVKELKDFYTEEEIRENMDKSLRWSTIKSFFTKEVNALARSARF